MTAVSLRLVLRCDAAALERDVALLSEAAQRLPHLGQAVVQLLDSGAELVRADLDRAVALPAGELRVRLEPADALAELVAAVRAGEFDA